MRSRVVPRPIIDAASCTACGVCVEVCPVSPKAVDFPETRTGSETPVPDFDYDHCIRCYCCQEMCPESAISLRTPLLGRLLHR